MCLFVYLLFLGGGGWLVTCMQHTLCVTFVPKGLASASSLFVCLFVSLFVVVWLVGSFVRSFVRCLHAADIV